MPKTPRPSSGRRTEGTTSSLAIRRGQVVALFQPIESLQSGECRGFEALARLSRDGELISPHSFLDALGAKDRLALFVAMLGEGIALLKQPGLAQQGIYVSINVEVSLLVGPDFLDVLAFSLDRYGFAGERLTFEILENEEVADFSRLQATLAGVHRFGISIALDDIGSGYASLAKMRDLPVDSVKLDRSFSRDLEMHPEDLIFVLSILALTRGLGKRLVVEGIETPEVYDALRILGVQYGQGYVIAPPMPADAVAAWLSGRTTRVPDKQPKCLLGAYASHLSVVESCRVLRRQPLPVAWTPEARDHRNCVVGKLFGARGWHETTFGLAHRNFHAVLSDFATDEARWQDGAANFRDAMAEAIAAKPREMRCDPVGPAAPPTRERVPKKLKVAAR